MSQVVQFLRLKVRKKVVIKSLKVSLVVGTLLNLINQGDALYGDAALDAWRAMLTYCVPFCVAMYGAVFVAKD